MHRAYDLAQGRGPKGENRVIRGGSWNNNAQNVRAAYRNHWHPSNRNNNLGFRLAPAQTLPGGLGSDPAAVPRARLRLGRIAGGEDLLRHRCAGRAAEAAATARRCSVFFREPPG